MLFHYFSIAMSRASRFMFCYPVLAMWLASTRISAQTPVGSSDYFPLVSGMTRVYLYQEVETTYSSLIALKTRSDSGIVRFEILSWSQRDSAMYWRIEETDSLRVHIHNMWPDPNSPADTTYDVVQRYAFDLAEVFRGDHPIRCQSRKPVWSLPQIWQGESGWDGTSPNDLLRYSVSDSTNRHLLDGGRRYYNHEGIKVFRKDVGLYEAAIRVWKGPLTPYQHAWGMRLIDPLVAVPDGHGSESKPVQEPAIFPNPIRDVMNVSVTLAGYEHVRIVIYDAFGRLIRVLADEETEPGNRIYTWRPASLSAGIYFCTITKKSGTSVHRILSIP